MLRSERYSRTESTTEPVSLVDARLQLRIDHTEDDGDLASMITEARQEAEMRLGDRSLINATCIDYFDKFADGMELHFSPVVSITSITYIDTNGATQTLSTSVYEIVNRNSMGIVRLKYGQVFPSTRAHGDVVAITYVAGYGTTAAAVPKGIRRWIKAKVAWLYENRDGVEFPFELDSLLSRDGTTRVYG